MKHPLASVAHVVAVLPLHAIPTAAHWSVQQCPPPVQRWPDGHVPLEPVHVPPAPSEPPQATPVQLGFLHTPCTFL
jgi:hypothetical protein